MNPKKEIFITATTDLEGLLELLDINEILYEKIRLSDFGEGVKKIIFEAIVLSKPSKLHPAEDFYDADKGLISGSAIVSYEAIKNSNRIDGVRRLLDGLFGLLGKYSTQVKEFDFEGLKRAILAAMESYQPIEVK